MTSKEIKIKKNLTIFERHEIKYMVNYEQRKLMEEGMAKYMTPDPHGQSTICNIYFDTPDFRLIRHSLEKPIYKEKIRVRSYGKVTDKDDVFLELKKKYKGVVYKRRIELSEQTAMAYMSGEIENSEELLLTEPRDQQIAKEIGYSRNFYPNLAPRVYLSYDRCAYFSKADPNLRLTFDRHIRWRKTDLSLTAEPGGTDLLDKGYSLMEIKTGTALPLWMVELLNDGEMRKASFSKYGKAYEGILNETPNNRLILSNLNTETNLEKSLDSRKDENDGKYIFKHNDRYPYGKEFYDKSGSCIGTGSGNRISAVI